MHSHNLFGTILQSYKMHASLGNAGDPPAPDCSTAEHDDKAENFRM